MTTIKAPYNFVPIHRKVVEPYWLQNISHDVPFEDSTSGEIVVTLEAASPIFVKNGEGKQEDKKYYDDKGVQENPYSFNQFQGKYFIPGSSLKGMVRSVLEVMSFGRMENKVNNHKYALRDLSSAMKDTYLSNFKPDIIRCGWLKKNADNSYTLADCGLPGRISHRHVDDELGTNFSTYYSKGGGFNQRNDYEKSAQKKYELFNDKERKHQFSLAPSQDTTGRKKFIINPKGGESGTLVFTGQPGVRKQLDNGRWTGHHLEFVFFDNNIQELTVPEQVIEDFFFAYYEHDKTKWSEDWKVWRKKLQSNEAIPVFFQEDGSGNIKHIGLSYLYKLPFNYSVKDSIQSYQGKTEFDLSEAIFGYIVEEEEEKKKGETLKEKGEALKGRVHFGHAFAETAEPMKQPKREVLAGPKASYYPNYIRQDVRNGKVRKYSTFMEEGAVIAGWKRYPVHSGEPKSNRPTKDVSEKVFTKFTPLKTGAKFKFKIRYHNLKEIELGALLSALTFHQTANTFHSLGMAKPLGYGKVKLTVSGMEEAEIKKCLSAYESYMNVELENDMPEWNVSEQITELIAMVSEQENEGASALEYMKLTDFVTAKNKDKPRKNSGIEALDKYSKLVNNYKTVQPICTPDTIKEMKTAMTKEREALKLLRPVTEIIEEHIADKKKELATLFEEKKRQLLEALEVKRQQIEQQEQKIKAQQEAEELRKRREEKQIIAQSKRIDLDGIDAKNRKAFDLLKKKVESYSRKFHNKTDSELRTAFPDGFLPKSAYEAVQNKLKKIFEALNKRNKQKWLKPNSAQRKKVAEWIGEEKMEEWFEKLKNN